MVRRLDWETILRSGVMVEDYENENRKSRKMAKTEIRVQREICKEGG